jgi:hypothetical protein
VRWLIVAVILMAIAVICLVRKAAEMERANQPRIHQIAA